MSISISQLFVRYPDEEDVAGLLAAWQAGHPEHLSFLAAKTPSPWVAVLAGDNAPLPEAARHLSRALEAHAVWFGLAGDALAYRLLRYELGREVERILVPPEIFRTEGMPLMPSYVDAECELHQRLRSLGIPPDYIYLFMEEVGVAGGEAGTTDASVIRKGAVENFVHRIPRRGSDAARTLFDVYEEGAQVVQEKLRLQGAFDPTRARQLLQTLEQICRRRAIPPDWKVRYLLRPGGESTLVPRLMELHGEGRFAYDLAPDPDAPP